jgi:hypothetical protein
MLDLSIVLHGDDCGTVLVVKMSSDELFCIDAQERKVISVPIVCWGFALRVEPHICLFKDWLSVFDCVKRHQFAQIQQQISTM